jgi:hypothetical protein
MVEMCVTPEKVGKDMRFFDVVKAPGNNHTGMIPTNKSHRSSTYRYGEDVDAKLNPA